MDVPLLASSHQRSDANLSWAECSRNFLLSHRHSRGTGGIGSKGLEAEALSTSSHRLPQNRCSDSKGHGCFGHDHRLAEHGNKWYSSMHCSKPLWRKLASVLPPNTQWHIDCHAKQCNGQHLFWQRLRA